MLPLGTEIDLDLRDLTDVFFLQDIRVSEEFCHCKPKFVSLFSLLRGDQQGGIAQEQDGKRDSGRLKIIPEFQPVGQLSPTPDITEVGQNYFLIQGPCDHIG